MKLKSRLCISLLLAFLSLTIVCANDQIVQKVILKNGSMYEGYIASQRIENKNVVFKSFCSTIVLPRNKYKNVTISNKDIEVSKLSEDWKVWAKENDAIKKDGSRDVVLLSTIIADNIELHDIFIEKLGEDIKYVSMMEQDLRLSLDSIVEIKVPERKKSCLSGLDRVYELVNGNRIQGEYRGELYGNGKEKKKVIKLLTEDGFVDIDKDDIVKCIFKPYNKDQSIFEQTPLIDVVRMKDGNTYEGVITEHNFTGEDTNGAFLTLMQNGGSMKMLSYKNIMEFGKERNFQYNPKIDILLNKDEFCINDSLLIFDNDNNDFKKVVNTDFYNYEKDDASINACIIASDSINTRTYKSNDKIVFSTFHGNKANNNRYVIIPIEKFNPLVDKNIKKKKNNDRSIEKKDYYKLDIVDVITKQIQPVKVSGPTKNGIVKYEFKVSIGNYILLDFLNLKYLILKVQ